MRFNSRLPWIWGATKAELKESYPSDAIVESGAKRVIRARSSSATAEDCFLWICQLRRAPYSYDIIDNFGKRSPRVPDLELTLLAAGQPFMTIFTLTAFDPGHSITLQMRRGRAERLFGPIVISYHIVQSGSGVRLICAMGVPAVGRLFPHARRLLLIWADLFMMRRQFAVLTGLAESHRRF